MTQAINSFIDELFLYDINELNTIAREPPFTGRLSCYTLIPYSKNIFFKRIVL